MRSVFLTTVALLSVSASGICANAEDIATFRAYVDTDICARLMLGPITSGRIECSQSTFKKGAEPVLIRLQNNMVFEVNKPKLLKPVMGQLVSVNGEAKPKDGTAKLTAVTPITDASIPAGDPARKLLDVRNYKTDSALHEKVRHELAMMPYISWYDFISFTMTGTDVILTGWTVRQTNRSTAYNVVKDIPGVGTVINNIDVLPLGSNDNQIRAVAMGKLQKLLPSYFWGSGSDIKAVVKNGQIILIGTVRSKSDSDIAYIQCNSVPMAFAVFNMLQVNAPVKKEKKPKKEG